jgi:hypothetical protein
MGVSISTLKKYENSKREIMHEKSSRVRSFRSHGVGRRTQLKAGSAIGAAKFASPFIIKARGEDAVKVTFNDRTHRM